MNKVLFPRITFWLLLLIPFTLLGFYPSYLARIFSPMASIYHVHGFFMVLWVAMAIAQPWLIKSKKTRLHRTIGRWSYVVMPLVLVTAFLVIRHGYHEDLQSAASAASAVASGKSNADDAAIRQSAAQGNAIGMVYLGWLALFYGLAVYHRRRMLYHATYMFAAILTILGPTVDRLIYNVLSGLAMPYGFLAEHAVFMGIIVLLIALLGYQYKKGNPLTPAAVSLGVYVLGWLVYLFVPATPFWSRLMEVVF